MALLAFRFFVLVMVLHFAEETSSHLDIYPYISNVDNPSSMVIMWQSIPVEIVVSSHLLVNVTMRSSKGAQNFHTMLNRNIDSPKETLTSKGYAYTLNDDYLKCNRKNKFVPLENGNKATFDCLVEPPYLGYSKPWIELNTGNIYCIFFPYSKDMKHHHTPVKEARDISAPSFALLLGRLSVSGTGKMMNITSEFNNVIISIHENTNVQIHWRKNDYLSMSMWEDFGISQSEVKELSVEDQIIFTLSAGQVKMIISYEVDESQIPVDKDLWVSVLIVCSSSIVSFIIFVMLHKLYPPKQIPRIEQKKVTTKAE